MSYALPPDNVLYPHRCNIYRPLENLQTTAEAVPGKPKATTLKSSTMDVKCYFQTGESVKAPEGFVLSEQDNLFTLDIIRFPDTVEVENGDVIQQTTGPNVGKLWTFRGDEKKRSQFGQHLIVRAARLPSKPLWVPD